MRVRIIGAGFYGCHIATTLIDDGHDVSIVEVKKDLFRGASGKIPARLHQGFHYPRSKATRDACRAHLPEFMEIYGRFTESVPNNIYAIAEGGSLVDFPQYVDSLSGEVPFEIIDPRSYGLRNVEGAVLTDERHIIIDEVKAFFRERLHKHIKYGHKLVDPGGRDFDLTVDATFCTYDNTFVDRYEPCVVGLLKGQTDTAITIMDGPFSSLYPWNEGRNLCSISSAKWTPLSKQCRTWSEARAILRELTCREMTKRVEEMMEDLARYYPGIHSYDMLDVMTSVRAMPFSGADTRLVNIVDVSERIVRIQAGKIDAVIHAAKLIQQRLEAL